MYHLKCALQRFPEDGLSSTDAKDSLKIVIFSRKEKMEEKCEKRFSKQCTTENKSEIRAE
jgi:hypothetical protein